MIVTHRTWSIFSLSLLIVAWEAMPAAAQQAETESARVLEPGLLEGGAGFEFQTSSEGSESAVPLIVEGGIAKRLELVVEQVAFVGLKPKVGANESGPGDLEATLVGLALKEQANIPAIAFAAEVKAPTANNVAIAKDNLIGASAVILRNTVVGGLYGARGTTVHEKHSAYDYYKVPESER